MPRMTNRTTGVLLALILLVALLLRLDGVGFGLPALNDPDEPLFMMTAFEMLRNQSFNPGWFGHPGTITLYSLALVMSAVAGIGIGSGQFADATAFANAVYQDPGLVFLPARLLMVACGVGCVALTWGIGKRLGGPALGLVAALFLAVNAIHVDYSRIIRTDVQASLLMLACTLSAITILRRGRTRDYLVAGLFAGLACATKWPAALVLLSPLCAGLHRLSTDPGGRAQHWRRLALVPLAAVVTLLLASPYLLLDHDALLRNLSGEARPYHPGATGGGLLANLGWYATHPLLSSLGLGGLVLAVLGLVWGHGDRRAWTLAVLPAALVFLLVIGLQSLRWERWVLPLLPFLSLAAARALCALTDLATTRFGARARWTGFVLPLLLALPMVATTRAETAERRNDTRQIASTWVRTHVPAGRTILIEHAAFDLLRGPWRFRFPLGSAGCQDVGDLLKGKIRYSDVETMRASSPIVDIGHVDSASLATCHADYAILTYHARYRTDPERYRAELSRYDRLIARGRLRAVIRPEPGVSSGPAVHIVEMRP